MTDTDTDARPVVPVVWAGDTKPTKVAPELSYIAPPLFRAEPGTPVVVVAAHHLAQLATLTDVAETVVRREFDLAAANSPDARAAALTALCGSVTTLWEALLTLGAGRPEDAPTANLAANTNGPTDA